MANVTTVGAFQIGPFGEIIGPAEYMGSESFRACKAKVEAGSHVLIGAFPVGTPMPQMLGVIFQTDFSAWLGQREIAGMSKRR